MDDFLAGDRPNKFGKHLDSFRPMPANVMAGFILAALSLGTGGLILWLIGAEIVKARGRLPILVDVGPSWVIFAFFAIVAVGFAWLSRFFLRLSTSLIGTGVAFYSEGFCLLDGEAGRDVPWAAVVGIRETVEYRRPPILKYPAILLLPKLASFSYLLETATGESHAFDGNSIGKIKRFGLLLRTEAGRRRIAWETVRIDLG